MITLSSPAGLQSTPLPPYADQLYPLNDSMDFTSSSVKDEVNTIWTPKIPNVDGVSQHCSPWPPLREPQLWTKAQVWQWLQQVTDQHHIDTASFPFLNFDVDGRQLCNMSYQDFILAAGSIGHILFYSIAELKWSGATERQYLGKCSDLSFACNSHERGDCNAECPDIRFPTEGAGTGITKTDVCSAHHELLTPDISASALRPEKKRARNVSHPSRKNCSPRGAHLWEFIRDILLNRECNPGLIRWEDRTAGVFRLLKSEAVAQLWGKKKNNCRMNYEKLGRAMRYYYKRGILERVDGQRLVYKFGINAEGWKESPK
ncbi:ETS homologous factor [Synchiropus picturatus]